MNIIVPGALNPDVTQQTYEFFGGPMHGSKLPVHPAIVERGIEVGLDIGGKMACYSRKVISNSAGHPKITYHYSP